MAERRLQVQELEQVAQSSVRPTARPVDTYVRPPASQTQPSELSQFLAAVAPAIQANAEETRKERLVRERKIQEGIYKKELAQATQARIELISQADQHYAANRNTEYLNLTDDAEGTAAQKVKAKRQAYYSQYLDSLRANGTDPVIIQALENDLILKDAVWMAEVYAKDKADYDQERISSNFISSVTAVTDSPHSRAIQVSNINDVYNSYVSANDGDYRAANDMMWEFAVTRAPVNADNAVVDWLKSPMSSRDGKTSQWKVGRRAKARAKIEKAILKQTTISSTAAKKLATQKHIQETTEQAIRDGDTSAVVTDRDVIVPGADGKTHSVKISFADVAPVAEEVFQKTIADIIKNTEVSDDDIGSDEFLVQTERQLLIAEAAKNRFELYKDNNLPLPEMAEAASNGKRFLVRGDFKTDPKNLENAMNMYKVLSEADALAGSTEGILKTVLDTDEAVRFRHLHAMVKGGKDFEDALATVQGRIYEDKKVTVTDEHTREVLDNLWPWLSKEAEANNLGIMTYEANLLANALIQTDPTYASNPEQARKDALEMIKGDFAAVRNTDGSISLIHKASNAIRKAAETEDIEQGLQEIKETPVLQEYINKLLSLDSVPVGPAVLRALSSEGLENRVGFKLFVANAANPNQLYVFAQVPGKPTEKALLSTVNVWDFNKNRIDNIKEQILKKYNNAVDVGQLAPTAPVAPSETEEKVSALRELYRQRAVERANLTKRKEALAAGGETFETSVLNPATEAMKEAFESGLLQLDKFLSSEDKKDLEKVGEAVDKTVEEDVEEAVEEVVEEVVKEVSFPEAVEEAATTIPLEDRFAKASPPTELPPPELPPTEMPPPEAVEEAPPSIPLEEASSSLPESSAKQLATLVADKFNMLYNVDEDGTISAVKWAKQTAGRVKREANRMAAEVNKVIAQAGEAKDEVLNAASSAVINAVIPQAKDANVGTAIVGKVPSVDTVVAIAGARNPADVAFQYMGMSEHTKEGATAIRGFFKNIVGNWKPNQSVEEFATSTAWCAAFLTQVLRDSGVDTTKLIKGDKFNQVRAAAYLKGGDVIKGSQALPGDIMIKKHSKAERRRYNSVAHVGIVAKVEGDTVYYIGGNTGNKVELAEYNMKKTDVHFRRIKGVTDLPTKSLPSLLELKAGRDARNNKAPKILQSLYDDQRIN